MKTIIQKAIVKVIQPQIVQYNCDECGDICGTRENPKETWYGQGHESHYCKRKGCSQARRLRRAFS